MLVGGVTYQREPAMTGGRRRDDGIRVATVVMAAHIAPAVLRRKGAAGRRCAAASFETGLVLSLSKGALLRMKFRNCRKNSLHPEE
jgi:hypothetical protein